MNYWPDYGGMESYVKWCTHSTSIANHTVSEFYVNTKCRQMYKNTMQTIMNRKNTINGRVYNQVSYSSTCSSSPSPSVTPWLLSR